VPGLIVGNFIETSWDNFHSDTTPFATVHGNFNHGHKQWTKLCRHATNMTAKRRILTKNV